MGFTTPAASGTTGTTNYPRANGEKEFYSRLSGNENIELFVDKSGNPTIGYPHVHVVHHRGGQVDVVASISAGNHVWRTTLQSPAGTDVENAISVAKTKI